MKKELKRNVTALFAVGFMGIGLLTGSTAYAAESNLGAVAAKQDSSYTLEDMLTYAMEDENLALAEYDAIMATYGVARPFSNIIRAEETHVALLTPLFEEYGVTIPSKDYASLAIVPSSLDEVYLAGITAEQNNIAMYDTFLEEALPEDVKDVFTALRDASKRHLAAFERQTGNSDNVCTYGNGRGTTGNEQSSARRNGRGANTNRQNGTCGQSCLLTTNE
ncbi:MAG: hypothetical protein PWP24_1064 [Clostridiales bacterium]|nr:hypothetical protein [Clostridiales bacterium]